MLKGVQADASAADASAASLSFRTRYTSMLPDQRPPPGKTQSAESAQLGCPPTCQLALNLQRSALYYSPRDTTINQLVPDPKPSAFPIQPTLRLP